MGRGTRAQPRRSPRGGPHLTAVISFLAFVAVANAISGGLRIVDDSHGHLHALRIGLNLLASVLLAAWALVRVRAQWASDGTAVAPPPSLPAGERQPPKPAPAPWRQWGRWVVSAGLLAVAAVTVASQWSTVEAAFGQLNHLHWRTLRWAIYAEALAMIAFAQLTRLLLRAGGVNLGLGSMVGLTLASNAVALTLPGGPAWAITFSFDQLHRRGVSRSLVAYALAVTWAMSAIALVVIALVGVDLAGTTGPAAPFRVIATVAIVAIAVAGLGALVMLRLPRHRAAVAARVQRLSTKPRWHRLAELVQTGGRELGQVRLPAIILVRCLAAAILNWMCDCGCLIFSILAVGGHVPWPGVIAAYGLTQLAAALPITPGGIGVVEGTLSLLLIAYHMPSATAVAGVLLYRIISFWVLVPVGWAAVGTLVAMQRRGHAKATWVPRLPRARRPRPTTA